MDFSSKLLEQAVDEMSQLPGIGKRTALRLVLHMLKQPESQTKQLADALTKLRTEIKLCKNCYNISDTDLCAICANPSRSSEIVCVVEDIRDVMAIENADQYRGHYHVLGGKISPMETSGSFVGVVPLMSMQMKLQPLALQSFYHLKPLLGFLYCFETFLNISHQDH